jgi:hypothetical protein
MGKQPDNPIDAATYKVEQEGGTHNNQDDERSPGNDEEKSLPSEGRSGKEPFHD